MALPPSVPGPGAAAAACGAHRHRAGEGRKTLRAAAYRGFQIIVGVFWDKNIFIGLAEMVHRIVHGCHPHAIGTIDVDYTPNAGRRIEASSQQPGRSARWNHGKIENANIGVPPP
jgi:hypothetical protein